MHDSVFRMLDIFFCYFFLCIDHILLPLSYLVFRIFFHLMALSCPSWSLLVLAMSFTWCSYASGGLQMSMVCCNVSFCFLGNLWRTFSSRTPHTNMSLNEESSKFLNPCKFAKYFKVCYMCISCFVCWFILR